MSKQVINCAVNGVIAKAGKYSGLCPKVGTNGKCAAEAGYECEHKQPVKPKEKTCGNCDAIKVSEVIGMYIFGCKHTGLVIPHGACSETKEVKFWRVPKTCPRSDDEVVKSDKQAPNKDWIIKTFSDFTPEEL